MIRAVSFSGCGLNGVYHLGATTALAKHLNFDELSFAGASAGSFAAVSAAVYPGNNVQAGMDLVQEVQSRARKHRYTNELAHQFKDLADGFYPDDLLDYVNGRVYISLTDMTSKLRPKNQLISTFESREHCLDCLVASCLVPGWAGYKCWTINGRTSYCVKYIDGGYTGNLPDIYPKETLRVQPFSTCSSHAEISPLLSNPDDEGKRIIKFEE